MKQTDFQSTIWTQIQRAKQDDPKALNDFALKYRPPVVKYIIQKGFSEDHAQDTAQEVFLVIFRENVLQKADSQKGRFRTLILAVTDHVIKRLKAKEAREKRGGESSVISLDEFEDDVLSPDIIPSEYKSEEFDKLWMHNILEIVLERLNKESTDHGLPYYKVLKMFVRDGDDYKTIAKKLNKTVDNVKNYLHRARLRLIEYIKQEINSYSSSRAEYDEDLNYLPRFIDNL